MRDGKDFQLLTDGATQPLPVWFSVTADWKPPSGTDQMSDTIQVIFVGAALESESRLEVYSSPEALHNFADSVRALFDDSDGGSHRHFETYDRAGARSVDFCSLVISRTSK
jgi:hypothetical protein